MTCPCGHHAACVPGCALMDYPGYTVDYVGGHTHEILPRSMWKQQTEAERSDIYCGAHSPELPDVTRDDPEFAAAMQHSIRAAEIANALADPAPVASLVQEIDDWYAANDPLMAGAGDGSGEPWTPARFIGGPDGYWHTPEELEELRIENEHVREPIPVLDSILEARGSRYGRFRDNADISQSLKEVIHQHTLSNWETLSSDQREALDQFACKISRILVGDPDYVDNWDDIAGYAKLVAERLRAS